MASRMYVDQLKDVLVHSTGKKVAGFITETIQVSRLCYIQCAILPIEPELIRGKALTYQKFGFINGLDNVN